MRPTIYALGFGLAVSFATGAALADATIETTSKTSGIQGMGASEMTSTTRYQGSKKSESSAIRFTGAVLSRLAGTTESGTITRVDKGVYWYLDPKSSDYREEPIVPPRLKDLAAESPEGAPKQKSEEKPRARVTKSEFSVKKTGKSETISGFPCDEYVITWLVELEDLETKAKSRSTMTTNLWTTPETASIRKVQAEEQQFNQALARKMGAELSPEDAKRMGLVAMGAMMALSEAEMQKGLARVKRETSKIKGYPIRTTVAWAVEAEETKGAPPTAREERGIDVSGGVGGLLGGIAGRMAQEKVEEKMAPSGGKGTPFFSSTLEIKVINTNGVPPETFEIPAGYKRK